MASTAQSGPVKLDDDKIPAEAPPWTFKDYAPIDSEDEFVTDGPKGADLSHWVATGYMRQMKQIAATQGSAQLYHWNGTPINVRWIEEPGIDSRILLSVVLEFVDIYGPEPLAHELPLICVVHTSQYGGLNIPVVQPSRYMRDERCTEADCCRCEHALGGYKFKWIAVEWLSAYVHHMRIVWADSPYQPNWHIQAAQGRTEHPQGAEVGALM